MNAPVTPPLHPMGFLVDDQALAAIVLWASGRFDTAAIAQVLNVREDAVCRTLHLARDAARHKRA